MMDKLKLGVLIHSLEQFSIKFNDIPLKLVRSL